MQTPARSHDQDGSVAIGQSVGTTDNVTFNTVTADLTGDVTGQVSDISNHVICLTRTPDTHAQVTRSTLDPRRPRQRERVSGVPVDIDSTFYLFLL